MIPLVNTNSTRPLARVLVIDDEPHVLSLASVMLGSQGFDVIGFESGDKAVEELSKCMHTDKEIAIVVLDLTMPAGLSGFEVLEQLLDIAPGLPVIACSGYFQEDARELCQSIGFADILQKPYAHEHLCDAVRRHLARERQPA